jgi:hypothetical protein
MPPLLADFFGRMLVRAAAALIASVYVGVGAQTGDRRKQRRAFTSR